MKLEGQIPTTHRRAGPVPTHNPITWDVVHQTGSRYSRRSCLSKKMRKVRKTRVYTHMHVYSTHVHPHINTDAPHIYIPTKEEEKAGTSMVSVGCSELCGAVTQGPPGQAPLGSGSPKCFLLFPCLGLQCSLSSQSTDVANCL